MTTATHFTGGDVAARQPAEPVERWADAPDERRAGSGRAETDGNQGAERLGRALGFFSVGLGLSQILAPRSVARAIGLEDNDRNQRLMTAFGVREVATGLGLLRRPGSAAMAWGRVAGDAMDLAVLGRALASNRNDHNRVAAAGAAVLGVMVVDVVAGMRSSRDVTGMPAVQGGRAIQVTKAITVSATPEEAYRLWRNFENLPRFMAHLESVRVLDQRRSYWKAKAPLGATVEWTAEITDDRPNESIAWQSVEPADVRNSGRVRFTPLSADRGVEVRVELNYDPPGGTIGATVAKLFGEEPSVQVDGDLRRFKQMLEVGEVVHSDASIHRGMHPARPGAPS
jgi:uncharacterized membrane protein